MFGGDNMKKDKPDKVEDKPRFYKGYDVRWLKKVEDHPDKKLVEEYESKYGEVK